MSVPEKNDESTRHILQNAFKKVHDFFEISAIVPTSSSKLASFGWRTGRLSLPLNVLFMFLFEFSLFDVPLPGVPDIYEATANMSFVVFLGNRI